MEKISILGDSISTLDGYNPEGYKVFYAGDTCKRSGVFRMEDTWWGQVIAHLHGELLVNNSWSGSRVTKMPGASSESLFPAGCSDERATALHRDEVMPDIILIYLGTNDWAFGAYTGNEPRLVGQDEYEFFDDAYCAMLEKVKDRYPQSEIWCFTLCETIIAENPDFAFPHRYGGMHIEEYNDIIRESVKRFDCKLIDLYHAHTPYETLDGTHPTANGMRTLASMVIAAMEDSVARSANGIYIDGKYRILKPINRTGAVEMYLAMNERINQFCRIDACGKTGKGAMVREYFLNEALAMMKLDHPLIPKVCKIVEDEEYTYVVREYIQGETLDVFIRKYGAMPVERVVDYSKQLCEVLKYLHGLNPPRVYGDMSPASILLQPDGSLKLIHFETMRHYDENKNGAWLLPRKGYSAPEQFGGWDQIDARADIFGLGMTMHHLLTGVNPIDPPYVTRPIRKIDPALPAKLEAIIQKCIEPDREKRYQSVDSLLKALNGEAEPRKKAGLLSRLFCKH